MANTETQSLIVRKSVLVNASQSKAFDVFTGGHGTWWPKETHYLGEQIPESVMLEPHVGGRWYQRSEDGVECDWGKVLVWDRPNKIVIAWQIGANWNSDPNKSSEVEIQFVAESPNSTRVELEHRLIEQHGPEAESIQRAVASDAGWSGLLRRFALVASDVH